MRLASRNNLLSGKSIYRSFESAEHADNLAAGRIWMSTLKRCRETEDATRQDPSEAYLTYKSGSIQGDSRNPAVMRVAARAGIRGLGENPNGTSSWIIENNTKIEHIQNGYLLCFSSEHLPKFGAHTVRIDEPLEFLRVVSMALSNLGIWFNGPWFGPVQYRTREYQGLDPDPPHIGFIKPEKFSPEREVRMLWDTAGRDIEPFSLPCAHARRYCTRL